MLAHVEEIQHLHPHPAGMAWEPLVLGAVALLVAVVMVGVLVRRATRSTVAAAAMEPAAPTGQE